MIFSKNISKNGTGRVPHFPGSGRRLAASAARKNSLRRQHLFYHAGKQKGTNRESKRKIRKIKQKKEQKRLIICLVLFIIGA